MKKNKGITLIALIVTILILLLLVGVGLNMAIGNSGVLNKAQTAKEQTDESGSKEKLLEKISELNLNVRIEQNRALIVTDLTSLDLSDGSGNVEIVGANGNITGAIITYNGYEFPFDINIQLVDKSKIKLSVNTGSTIEEKSIYEALQNVTFNGNGNYTLKINGKTSGGTSETISYPVNLIKYDGNLVLDGTTSVTGSTLTSNVYEFGDNTKDVATSSTNATNTVILEVNGDLTINNGVTLTACKSTRNYGGPKGLIIYCTGTLINNGIISMTARGAKATGEDVYLYRNSNSTYEYVPAVGATGGAAQSITSGTSSINGIAGALGTNRQTGGGGSGAGRRYAYNIYIGRGGIGTSYSGGSGSGASNSDGGSGGVATSSAGSDIGGSGSNGANVSGNSSGYGVASMGGVGNATGSYLTYKLTVLNYVYRTGTGGLLVIYANTFNNNNIISSDGVSSSTGNRSSTYARIDTGGASGAGSVNIFYNNLINKGTVTANGGASIYGEGGNAGGAGGNGSVTIGSILTNIFIKN